MTRLSKPANRIHELFPYLCVENAERAIHFYTEVFGARELFRLTEPSGRVGHAQLEFAPGIVVMLAEPFPESGVAPPVPGAAASLSVHLHVDNADELIARAVEAGATLERAPQDEFYGERGGVIRDPFGHRWNIGHTIEQVTPEEMQSRYNALLAGG